VECELDEAFALSLVGELKDGHSSRYRNRRFVYGALYDMIYPGHKIVDCSTNSWCEDGVDIIVTLADGTKSVVKVGSAASESEMLNAIAGLGTVLPAVGNARGGAGDMGDMYALGYRTNAHLYVPTNKPEIAVAMEATSAAAGEYMQKHWPDEYQWYFLGCREVEVVDIAAVDYLLNVRNWPASWLVQSWGFTPLFAFVFEDKLDKLGFFSSSTTKTTVPQPNLQIFLKQICKWNGRIRISWYWLDIKFTNTRIESLVEACKGKVVLTDPVTHCTTVVWT
jgi:hypothetical protein